MKPASNLLGDLYKTPLALLTDLYQLTMAYGYWKLQRQNEQAVFHLYFRNNPFHGGYAIAAGLQRVIEYISSFAFDDSDGSYLASLVGSDEQPLFDRAFIAALRQMSLTCDIDAIPEGTVVFAGEPLIRVQGPLWQCQLLETALLNFVNFQTLIATKSARVCQAAKGDAVLEFGLRRAQGIDGALSASRAAYIGGCSSTSNVLAGKMFGIPVKGTHAHSWIMSFDDESEAFDAYARAMPNNCVFLVDTYDTLEGVRRAVEIGQCLKDSGHRMLGIRLDSGDLAYLSIEARKILDSAGLQDAQILASNDLDEHLIESLKLQGAKIAIWGVGTKLVTAYDQPALGGVYKLSAIRDNAQQPWRYTMKVSEQMAKSSYPGILQVRRYRDYDNRFVADMIYSEPHEIASPPTIVDPKDVTRERIIESTLSWENLLVPIFRSGKLVYQSPELQQIQNRVRDQLTHLHPSIRRFTNPHEYPVGLEQHLSSLRTKLIIQARQRKSERSLIEVS